MPTPPRRRPRPRRIAASPGPRALSLLCLTLAALLTAVAGAQVPGDPPRGDLRVAVFGDFNGPYGALEYPAPVTKVVRAIAEVWRPDLLLSPGDVIAGQKASLSDEHRSRMWTAFDREVAGPLREAGIPYAVAMGNHDASSLPDAGGGYLFGRDRIAAEAYWRDPRHDGGVRYVDRERHPFDHAFRAGEAFVAVIDASSARVTPEQRAWLGEVLRRPEATSARLRIVVGHLPLVPVARGREGPGEVVADADGLRRVLEDGRVDAYVSGHHAAYFPGRLGDLELLFAGGVGARRLLAGDAPPRSTVTLVDAWYAPFELRYTTFDVATMEVVAAASLPVGIDSELGPVRRSERACPASRCEGPEARRSP